MCGIYTYIGKDVNLKYNILTNASNKINHRGPDNTKNIVVNDEIFLFKDKVMIIR